MVVHQSEKKTPSRSCNSERGSSLFSAYGPKTIRQATCKCSTKLHLLRRTEAEIKINPWRFTSLPLKMGGRGRKISIAYFRQKNRSFSSQKSPLFFFYAFSHNFSTVFSKRLTFWTKQTTLSCRYRRKIQRRKGRKED